MRNRLVITEADLHRIVRESISRMLNEGKIETQEPGEFVTWDDAQSFCNHNYDTVERNERRCEKLGIPKDQRCSFCQKPLKGVYKVLYVSDDYNDIEYHAQPDEKHNRPLKVGKTCAKAFEQAHKLKYGK